MSLLADLRGIENFTPSHQPALSEVLEIVGKLVAYIEHGDELLKAADQDAKAREAGEPALHVNDLLAPPSDEELAARPQPPSSGPSPADVAKDAEIAQLRQELATAQAQNQRTTIDVVPDEQPATTSPAPVDPAPAAAPAPAPTPIPAPPEGQV